MKNIQKIFLSTALAVLSLNGIQLMPIFSGTVQAASCYGETAGVDCVKVITQATHECKTISEPQDLCVARLSDQIAKQELHYIQAIADVSKFPPGRSCQYNARFQYAPSYNTPDGINCYNVLYSTPKDICRRSPTKGDNDRIVCDRRSVGAYERTFLNEFKRVITAKIAAENAARIEAAAAKRTELEQYRVLKAAEVQSYITAGFHSLRAVNTPDFLYDGLFYFEEKTVASGFNHFINTVSRINPKALVDESVRSSAWVPIAVNDITTFVEVSGSFPYQESRPQRRVSSPLVDLRLVREQLRKLTKRSWLRGHTNMEQFVLQLYENGAKYSLHRAKKRGILGIILSILQRVKLGDPLTAYQQWNVPQDMIWPEYRIIDGVEVLVPVVYLSQSTYQSNELTGSQVVAGSAQLNYDSFTVDGGELIARRNLILQAANGIHNNEGNIEAGGELWAQAGGVLDNLSGTIRGQQVKLLADEINNETLVIRHDYANGYSETSKALATITSFGNLVIDSNGDVVLSGSQINANGNINIKSGGSIALLTTPVSEYFSDSGTAHDGIEWSITEAATVRVQSQLSGANITLLAAETIQVEGSTIESEGELALLAGMGIYIINAENTSSSSYSFSSATGGAFGSEDSIDEQRQKIEIVRSKLSAGKDIALKTLQGDITLKGVDLNAKGQLLVEASNGGLYLQVAKEFDYYSYEEKTEDLLIFSNTGYGHSIETAVQNELNAQGGFTFSAGKGIFVEYTGDAATLEENLNTLAERPGMQWINTVREQNSTQWTQIQLQAETWSYSTQGLTKVGAALLQIAIMAMTGGMDVSSLFADGLVGAAMQAGTTTLLTQAGHALVANGFNPVDTLKDMGSKDNIKALLRSMTTAAVMQQFGGLGEMQSTNGVGFFDQSIDMLRQTSVSAALNVTFDGGNFGDAWKTSISNSIVSQVGAWAANKIGDFASSSIKQQANYQMTEAVRLLSHAALGCALGKIKSNDCDSGATGAVTGEVLAQLAGNYIDPDNTLTAQQRADRIHTFSMIGTVLIADLADKDIGIAQETGSNAVLNNYLKHAEQDEFATELNACKAMAAKSPEQVNCLNATFAKFQQKSDENNLALAAAYESCKVGSGSSVDSPACQSYIALASEGVPFLTTTFKNPFHVKEIVEASADKGGIIGSTLTPEQIENSLKRAIEDNDDFFEALINRQLDQEVAVLPGAKAGRGYIHGPKNADQYISAITAEHNEMVVKGAGFIVLTASGLGLEALAGRTIGSLVANANGKIVGLLKSSSTGVSRLQSSDAVTDLPPDVSALKLWETGDVTDSVWKLKPTDRGRAIEDMLNHSDYHDWENIGALHNGYFPLVDFQKETNLVSLKTVDTSGATWLGRMENHIDELATRSATVNNQPASVILDIRVQPGGLDAAASLIRYGSDRGIPVVVKEFR